MLYICDMGEIEIGRCGFCNDVKPVNRFYMYPSLYKKPENTKGLYNDGDYFIITYWCNDCGKPGIEKDYYYDPKQPLFKDANDLKDFLAKHPDMFSYTPAHKDLGGLLKQIEAHSKIKNNVDNVKSYRRNQPNNILYMGYSNYLRWDDYLKRENAYFSPRTGVEYLSQCFLSGKKLHKINSGISWVQIMGIGRCIDSNGWICTLGFVLDDIKKYPTKWRVYEENSAKTALQLDKQPLKTEVEKELFFPEENNDKLGKGGTGFKLALSHAWFPKPKLSFLKRVVNAIRNKIIFNDKKS